MTKVWREMDDQIAKLRAWQGNRDCPLLALQPISYFAILGIDYAALLGHYGGALSVLIPYIGAALVTLPVALIGFFQWGWTDDFMYLMIALCHHSGVWMANVLVPLLFSEAVKPAPGGRS